MSPESGSEGIGEISLFSSQVLDISSGGLRIASDLPDGGGREVELEFVVPDDPGPPVRMPAVVRWNRVDEQGRRTQGLQFDRPPAEDLRRFRTFLARFVDLEQAGFEEEIIEAGELTEDVYGELSPEARRMAEQLQASGAARVESAETPAPLETLDPEPAVEQADSRAPLRFDLPLADGSGDPDGAERGPDPRAPGDVETPPAPTPEPQAPVPLTRDALALELEQVRLKALAFEVELLERLRADEPVGEVLLAEREALEQLVAELTRRVETYSVDGLPRPSDA